MWLQFLNAKERINSNPLWQAVQSDSWLVNPFRANKQSWYAPVKNFANNNYNKDAGVVKYSSAATTMSCLKEGIFTWNPVKFRKKNWLSWNIFLWLSSLTNIRVFPCCENLKTSLDANSTFWSCKSAF